MQTTVTQREKVNKNKKSKKKCAKAHNKYSSFRMTSDGSEKTRIMF